MRYTGGYCTAACIAFLLSELAVPAAVANNAIYDANCGLCHQKDATGLPGQFPRLAGRIRRLTATPGSRRYVIQVLLFGLSGRIRVDDAFINGVMPSFSSLSDADIAAVLNYLSSLGDRPTKASPAIVVAEVKAVHSAAPMSTQQVKDVRTALVDAGTIQ